VVIAAKLITYQSLDGNLPPIEFDQFYAIQSVGYQAQTIIFKAHLLYFELFINSAHANVEDHERE
jgi:hypothetical protein